MSSLVWPATRSYGVRSWACAFGALLLVGLFVSLQTVHKQPATSPIDEYVFIDAIDKALHLDITQQGEKTGQYARDAIACRGINLYGPIGGSCGTYHPDASAPLGGVTAADIHPPTYFFITAGGVWALESTKLMQDTIDAARIVGGVWFAIGALAWVYLALLWGASLAPATAVAMAMGLSPFSATIHAYVTPDASSLLVSAALYIAVTRWIQGRLPWALLAIASILPLLFKMNNVITLMTGVLLLASAALLGYTSRRRAIIGAVVMSSAGAAALIAWTTVRGLVAVAPAVPHPEGTPPLTREYLSLFPFYHLRVLPTAGPESVPLPFFLDGLAWILGALAISAAVGHLMWMRSDQVLGVAAAAGTVAASISAVALSSMVYLQAGGLLTPQPRYGFTAYVLFTVPLMVASSRRWLLTVLVMLIAAAALLYLNWG